MWMRCELRCGRAVRALCVVLLVFGVFSGAAAAAERPLLLVMPLESKSADAAFVETVNALVVTSLADAAKDRQVTSVADLRRLMDLEAEREALGCDDAGNACWAEMAAAYGAEHVVFGTLGSLGGSTVITLHMMDAERAVTLARRTIQAQSEEDLPGVLHAGTRQLLRDSALQTSATTVSPGGGAAWAAGAASAVALGGLATAGGVEWALGNTGFSSADDYKAARAAGQVGLWTGVVATVVAAGMWVWAAVGHEAPNESGGAA